MAPDANYHASSENGRPGPIAPESVERTGRYAADDGIVFYDARNPFAWLRSDAVRSLSELR